VLGALASNLRAYSFGTGAVTGMTIAAAASGADGRLKRKISVCSSGVSMPEIGL
jgi:hypothetical protein